ncbi:MAG: CPBP family glutamic-type intramembrane protease [archaeon]|jgi:hypothetical protein
MNLLIILFFLVPLFYYRIRGISWEVVKEELLIHNKDWKTEIIGGVKLCGLLILGFFVIALALSLFQGVTGIAINDMDKVDSIITEEITTNLTNFLIVLAIGLFAEEFFFRAFLVKKTGPIISTIIFSIFHIGYGSISEIIGVFFLGLILAYWFTKHKSIVQNYIGHVLYDILAIMLYVLI